MTNHLRMQDKWWLRRDKRLDSGTIPGNPGRLGSLLFISNTYQDLFLNGQCFCLCESHIYSNMLQMTRK